MSVSAEAVLRLAQLAELAVADAELPALTAQLDRIVTFVAQLADLPEQPDNAAGPLEPAPGALRPDVVRPAGLARDISAFAPEFVDGFFVVPRLGAMDGS